MTPAEFRDCIGRFEIGYPLKAWDPRFEYDEKHFKLILRLFGKIENREGQAVLTGLMPMEGFREADGLIYVDGHYLYPGDSSTFNISRDQNVVIESMAVPEDAYRVLRTHLIEKIAHEVDESILIEGIRMFDPHAPGRAG